MIDGGLRSMFHDRLRERAHWVAIESGMVVLGVPDSNCCMEDGAEFWVEYKYTSAWKVTPSCPQQIGWPIRRTLLGGRVFIAVRREHDGGPRRGKPVDELWIFRGADAREVYGQGLRGSARPLGVWRDGPTSWDWQEVRAVLTSPVDLYL